MKSNISELLANMQAEVDRRAAEKESKAMADARQRQNYALMPRAQQARLAREARDGPGERAGESGRVAESGEETRITGGRAKPASRHIERT